MHEVGKRASIIQAHTRSVGIEDTHNACIYAMVSVVGHGHGLRVAFGFVIYAARTDGIDMPPVGFRLRGDFGIAVTLARGCQKKLGSFGKREPEGIVRAQRTYL